jgi:hypothetical protein
MKNFVLSAVTCFSLLLFGSGCKTCDLKTTSVSARVVRTSITAPPGGAARRYLEIHGTGFHPNVQVRIALDLPTPTGTEKVEHFMFTNSQGSVLWEKEPIPFLIPNPEPNALVFIGVSETKSGCFGATHLRRGEFGF